MWWQDFIKLLSDHSPLINLLVAIAWGIYIYYTIKTFKAIHRQTELQSEAFLVVSSEITDRVVIDKTNSSVLALYEKWRGILSTNIPESQQPGKNVLLRLINRGRSDIIWWRIKLSIQIEPGKHLLSKFNIRGEVFDTIIEQEGHKDLIEPGACIEIFVAKSGAFPTVTFQWTIEYRDSREVIYTRFGGDKFIKDRNALADPLAYPAA